MTVKRSLKKLKRHMALTNIFFHLVRNNPRHREQYYFGFIAIVGFDNWKRMPDVIRMNWESARLSFDKMYGMVKDFKEHSDIYADYIKNANLPVEVADLLSGLKRLYQRELCDKKEI